MSSITRLGSALPADQRRCRAPGPRISGGGAAFDEGHEVLLGVAKKGHPLFAADRPEVTGVVAVHAMRFRDELDAGGLQRSMAGVDVVDFEVDDNRCRAAFEQQPCVAEVEEREARRIEPSDEGEAECVAVERDRAVEIVRVLRDLVNSLQCRGHVTIRGESSRNRGDVATR